MRNTFLEEKIKEARAQVVSLLDGHTEAIPTSCLYHAIAMQNVLGPQCKIVAGSYQWQFTLFDDGQNATHFSCMFDRTAQILAQEMLQNLNGDSLLGIPHLPEMHVWNMWCGKLLDTTSCYVPEFARRNGFSFEEVLTPPEYLFTDKLTHKKFRYVYRPHPLATELANVAAAHIRYSRIATVP